MSLSTSLSFRDIQFPQRQPSQALRDCLAANMAVLRFVFNAFGLLLALSLAGYPVITNALYMPQGFNLAAARNETDGRLAQAATHSYSDMDPTAMAGAGTGMLVPRDVWSPVILSPDGNVVWRAGSVEEVKWWVDLQCLTSEGPRVMFIM